jgi:hypothetical protein
MQPGWLAKLRALVLLTDTLIKVACMPLVALAEFFCLRAGRTRRTSVSVAARSVGAGGRRGAPVAPTVRHTLYFVQRTAPGR